MTNHKVCVCIIIRLISHSQRLYKLEIAKPISKKHHPQTNTKTTPILTDTACTSLDNPPLQPLHAPLSHHILTLQPARRKTRLIKEREIICARPTISPHVKHNNSKHKNFSFSGSAIQINPKSNSSNFIIRILKIFTRSPQTLTLAPIKPNLHLRKFQRAKSG